MKIPSTSVQFSDALPALDQALQREGVAVLVAPPGEGKTTRVPLSLLDAPWLSGRRTLLLEPRRLAAVNAATYMASRLGEPVGERVGYTMRHARQVSRSTRVEVITEGILARRLQQDPELHGVGLVIFDEFHERSLHSDLALALCRDLREGLRDDLRLLIMSATLDSERLSRYLDDCPVISVDGKRFPVEIRYTPAPENSDLGQGVAWGVAQALKRCDGDLLAFLPGAREIRRCESLLREQADIDVRTLYGDLPFERQQEAILPGSRRRVVLATNIAETSLTIEGVTGVVDCGFERRPRFNPASGLSLLETARISRQSADQRAGRAGRTAPGVCWRLWGEGVQGGLLPEAPPEIMVADLAALALDLAGWGVPDPLQLDWLDPPPAGAYAAAQRVLGYLGAVDSQGMLTGTGRAMLTIPSHPRHARLLLAARELDVLPIGCLLVALLEEGELRTLPRGDGEDLHACFEHVADSSPRRRHFPRTERTYQFWLRHFGATGEVGVGADEKLLGRLLATAYPDRVAVQREAGSPAYRLSSGRGCRLETASPLFGTELLVVPELMEDGGSEARVRWGCRVGRSDLCTDLAGLIEARRSAEFNPRTQKVEAWEGLHLIQAPLERRRVEPTPLERESALAGAVRSLGLEALGWSRSSRQLRGRLALLHRLDPDEWPGVGDEELLEGLESWLLPYLHGIRDVRGLRAFDPGSALVGRLAGRQRSRLDALVPETLEVPSGSRIRLDYCCGEQPVLAVKLQEMFGAQETPRLAEGRLSVMVHLLSPAGRPVQVTSDLGHFWREIYPEVRKELRGRYPKHPWPEDPLGAIPTRHVKKRT